MLHEKWHINPGERVLLVYPFGLDFIAAFFGCMRAGVVAVPVYPPDPTAPAVGLKRIFQVMANCGADSILTVNSLTWAKPWWWLMTASTVSWPSHLNWRATDEVTSDSQKQWLYPPLLDKANDVNHLVFLQYTSGSTSEPKGAVLCNFFASLLHSASWKFSLFIVGVMIHASQLSYDLSLITARMHLTPECNPVASWVPQYHG